MSTLLLIAFLSPFLAVGWRRFALRKAQFTKFLAATEKPTSQKQRIESDF